MGGDEHGLAGLDQRGDLGLVIGQDTGRRILEAFAARRGHVIGAAPDMDLLLAPFFPRVILVEPGEIAIVALIERLVLHDLDIALAKLGKHEAVRFLRARKFGGEGDIKRKPGLLHHLARFRRFGLALRGQPRITPAREKVFLVPFALSVTDKHKQIAHVLLH